MIIRHACVFVFFIVAVFSSIPVLAEEEDYAEKIEHKKEAIVVWRLEQKRGVRKKDIDSISSFIAAQVEKYSNRKVISEADIRTILKGEEIRQKCGSDDTVCVVEIGAALGVSEAVSGDLGKLGSFWMLNLRHINVRSAEVLKRSSRNIKGTIDNLILALPGAVAELFGRSAGEGSETPMTTDFHGTDSAPTLAAIFSVRRRSNFGNPDRLTSGFQPRFSDAVRRAW